MPFNIELSDASYALARKFSGRFSEPSESQVQSVLETLDSKSQTWDDTDPKMFFKELKRQFPELAL